MPFERLDNLVKIGQLKAESPARAEFDGLVRSAVSRIKDAENESLSIESRGRGIEVPSMTYVIGTTSVRQRE